ncbi:hypothetical protein [Aeromonas veronii]|uniref:hypothetical protein n=1 Tax=Aeromonas veronii TaxID=654 RepID=UPI00142F3FBA|nr:hypothetical protein [Aeromonas veronii]EKP0246278.1 hypothetical protein [Aeromonas veronii]MBL0455121.1 hypothetical protein [Aeromonas veronii]NJI24486.1 hypothetical protein [Aeromonas veronii]NJI33045.1 hypothetical protein [Aeromonas veronii]HDO1318922.1 hypothetical protein [Aeromonas veronii]
MGLDFRELKKQSEQSVKRDENVDKQIESLENELGKKLRENEHKTRNWLTTGFIIGLFSLIVLSAVYVVYHNNQLIDLAIRAREKGIIIEPSDIGFLSFESVYSLLFNSLGTSLGFIIGYYFKEKVSK